MLSVSPSLNHADDVKQRLGIIWNLMGCHAGSQEEQRQESKADLPAEDAEATCHEASWQLSWHR